MSFATVNKLRPSRASIQNVFIESISSGETSSVSFDIKHEHHSQVSSRKVVDEIINKIFDERKGEFEVSSSSCSSLQPRPSKSSFDKRLKYWKDMLEERKRIENYIRTKTGKKREEMLINRPVTVDAPDKQTVVRLLDYAERLSPITLQTTRRAVLPEICVPETCLVAHKIEETIPKAEQEGHTRLEVSAMPAATREEQLGDPTEQGGVKKWNWLKSDLVKKRICERRADMERVIEHFPDTDKLQIVGEGLLRLTEIRHDAEIEFIREEDLKEVSSDTSTTQIECKADEPVVVEEFIEYGIKINDQTFYKGAKRSAKGVDFNVRFECEPYEKLTRRILRLQNIGKKILNCEFIRRPYYDNAPMLLKSCDDDFLFDNLPFRLLSGEVRDIIIQYRPRRVSVVKERWLLKVEPQIFFCRKKDSVVLSLTGKCKPSPEYLEKLNKTQQLVINKSNMKMMTKLTGVIGTQIPLLQPYEVVCPYKRILNDRELFEYNNIGYKCERFHDLELLKELYHRIKKPREPEWDLQLDTLKEKILRIDDAERRALLFAEMMGVLQEMKGGFPIIMEQDIVESNPEKERARFVYVRGIICTSIDEWESLAAQTEEAFYKVLLKEYENELAEEDEHSSSTTDSSNANAAVNDEDPREIVLERVKHNKAFRDTLYMQTYTLLCDFAEDIVSIIESTEIF